MKIIRNEFGTEIDTSTIGGTSVSFCTTCMNRAHNLKLTLPNNIKVLEESGIDYEICLVNWGSKDDLDEWLRSEYDHLIGNKIKYLVLEKSGFEMAPAKNAAHRMGTKQFLCNVDADNYIQAEWLQFCLDAIKKTSNVVIRPCSKKDKGAGGRGRIFCSKKAYDDLGGYDDKFKLYGGDDSDFHYRLMDYGATNIVYPGRLKTIPSREDKQNDTYIDATRKQRKRHRRNNRNALKNRDRLEAKTDFRTTVVSFFPAKSSLYNFNIFRHFIDYYLNLNCVDQILLVVNYIDATDLNDLLNIVSYYSDRVVVVHEWKGDFSESERIDIERSVVRNRIQTEYVSYLDSDEFVNLDDIVLDGDYCVGLFTDRISSDGTLADIEYPEPLYKQFPKLVSIQKDIMNACDKKVILCPRDYDLKGGHHSVAKRHRRSKKCSDVCQINHYKFDSKLAAREEYKVSYQENSKSDYSKEQKLLLDRISDDLLDLS